MSRITKTVFLIISIFLFGIIITAGTATAEDLGDSSTDQRIAFLYRDYDILSLVVDDRIKSAKNHIIDCDKSRFDEDMKWLEADLKLCYTPEKLSGGPALDLEMPGNVYTEAQVSNITNLNQKYMQLAEKIHAAMKELKKEYKFNCERPVEAPPQRPPEIPSEEPKEDISNWTIVAKGGVKDSDTGQPLDEDIIVVPEGQDSTPKTKDDPWKPTKGDTIIISAPCHTKKIYVVGRDKIPDNLILDPKSIQFVINCGDKAALENIRKALAEQGITHDPVDVEITKWMWGRSEYRGEVVEKDLCLVTIKKYKRKRYFGGDKEYVFTCPDLVPRGEKGRDVSQCPPPDTAGWFEPNEPRDGQAEAEEFPRDPFYHSKGSWSQKYDDQWALKRIGFSVKAGEDWKSLWPKTGHPVVVAVIDTGVDLRHEELRGAIWLNSKEIPYNGKDDDNNGYIDDIRGWNFIDNNNDISDNNGHGTLIAGIIAAWTDNGVGIAGVNPWAVIMPVKALDFNNKGGSIILATAIAYAVDNGARVINLSVGGRNLTEVERRAVEYADRKGVLVVVAAGNEGINTKDFSPAGFKSVVTVASTDTNDKRVGFSNWGREVDLAAPGIDVLSLRAGGTDYLILGKKDYTPGLAFVGKNKRYYRTAGSSFSAPFVAGVASLIATRNPNITGEQLRRMIVYSAKDIDVPGRDQYTGYGLLDAKAALKADPNFFLEVGIDGTKLAGKGSQLSIEVKGTCDADQFKEAHIEIGMGLDPKEWQFVSQKITKPVKNNILVVIPLGKFEGSPDWIIRLIAEHKNGRKQEVRHILKLK